MKPDRQWIETRRQSAVSPACGFWAGKGTSLRSLAPMDWQKRKPGQILSDLNPQSSFGADKKLLGQRVGPCPLFWPLSFRPLCATDLPRHTVINLVGSNPYRSGNSAI